VQLSQRLSRWLVSASFEAEQREEQHQNHLSRWWAELRAVAKMTPQPQPRLCEGEVGHVLRSAALRPQDLAALAGAVGVAVEGLADSSRLPVLVPLLAELARAPLPSKWCRITKGGSEGSAEDAAGSAAPSFVHGSSGRVASGHPVAEELKPLFEQVAYGRGLPRPMDSWVCFAKAADEASHKAGGRGGGGGGESSVANHADVRVRVHVHTGDPAVARVSIQAGEAKRVARHVAFYWHDYSSGASSDEILPKAALSTLTKCVMPLTSHEKSAAAIIDSTAAVCWPGLSGTALLQAAEEEIWWGGGALRRAQALAVQPCPLPVLLDMSLQLGVDPATHPNLLWLAHAALTPELPPGWICCPLPSSARAGGAEAYFWQPACGLTQWEHPYISFLSGVAQRLLRGT